MINELQIQDGWLTQKGEIADDLRTFQKHIVGVKATDEFWKVVTDAYKEQWEAEHPQPEMTE